MWVTLRGVTFRGFRRATYGRLTTLWPGWAGWLARWRRASRGDGPAFDARTPRRRARPTTGFRQRERIGVQGDGRHHSWGDAGDRGGAGVDARLVPALLHACTPVSGSGQGRAPRLEGGPRRYGHLHGQARCRDRRTVTLFSLAQRLALVERDGALRGVTPHQNTAKLTTFAGGTTAAAPTWQTALCCAPERRG